jgi:hypothetical protein
MCRNLLEITFQYLLFKVLYFKIKLFDKDLCIFSCSIFFLIFNETCLYLWDIISTVAEPQKKTSQKYQTALF